MDAKHQPVPWHDRAVVIAHATAEAPLRRELFEGTLGAAVLWMKKRHLSARGHSIFLPDRALPPRSVMKEDLARLLHLNHHVIEAECKVRS